MIKWHQALYMDETIRFKQKEIMKNIESGKKTEGVFCILLPANSQNLLEIMKADELKCIHNKNRNIYIVGLAEGKESAVNLVARLIEEVYFYTGNFQIEPYIKRQVTDDAGNCSSYFENN